MTSFLLFPWRRRFVLWVARILRVPMYAHWSENPANWETHSEVSVDHEDLCSKEGCTRKAYANMSGAAFCFEHQWAIRQERCRTGKIGPVSPDEGMGIE